MGCRAEREGRTAFSERVYGFVSLCPELDIASHGASIEEARANLIEALTLFFETADPSEVSRRYHGDVLVTQVEVPVGQASSFPGPGGLRDTRRARLLNGPPARPPYRAAFVNPG